MFHTNGTFDPPEGSVHIACTAPSATFTRSKPANWRKFYGPRPKSPIAGMARDMPCINDEVSQATLYLRAMMAQNGYTAEEAQARLDGQRHCGLISAVMGPEPDDAPVKIKRPSPKKLAAQALALLSAGDVDGARAVLQALAA